MIVIAFSACGKGEDNENSEIKVTGIYIYPQEITLQSYEWSTVTAEVEPSNATNQAISWKSLDPNVASVTSDGSVWDEGIGETYIIATTDDGNFTGSCKVLVTPSEYDDPNGTYHQNLHMQTMRDKDRKKYSITAR